MTLVKCAPVGYIEMIDNGERDEKIIAIPQYKSSPYAHIKDIADVPPHMINELMHFLRVYKDLEKDNKVEIKKIHNRAAAIKIIKEAMVRYNKK